MKRFYSFLVISGLALNLLIFVSSCEKDDTTANITETLEISSSELKSEIENWIGCFVETDELTEKEDSMLIYMKEEEKLARDVYAVLNKKWNIPIFYNISNSEQDHINAVLALIDYYSLESTEIGDTGVFESDEFTNLYDSLITEGSYSIEKALKIGILIEDKDIYDLSNYLDSTTNVNITQVFGNLLEGSINHIQAFTRQLIKYNPDFEYEAKYISQEKYDSIISGDFSVESGENRGYGNRKGYRKGYGNANRNR